MLQRADPEYAYHLDVTVEDYQDRKQEQDQELVPAEYDSLHVVTEVRISARGDDHDTLIVVKTSAPRLLL